MATATSRRKAARAALATGLLREDSLRPSSPRLSPRRDGLAAFICGLLLIYRPFRALFPTWLLRVALLPGVIHLGWKLWRFPRWGDENKHVPRFLLCAAALTVQMFLELLLIWLAAVSDQAKYSTAPGLQDNVDIALGWLAERSPLWRAVIRAHWLDSLSFLLVFLATLLSPLWDQVPFSGFAMASRMLLTIAVSRMLRCACFMATILPNPRPDCYRRKFPPVPGTTWETLTYPFSHVSFAGGCNDLIFSGHCGFWTTSLLVLHAYYPGHPGCLLLLGAGLVQTAARDVVEHYHYSVDMILGVFCTWAVWRWLEPLYPPEASRLHPRPPGFPPDPRHPGVMLLAGAAVAGGLAIIIGLD